MIVIQKRIGTGEWFNWATADTVDDAIDAVKNYCLGDQAAFRVAEVTFGGLVVHFTWGPLNWQVAQ